MNKQSGIATVEFAILATSFMLIILGSIEISRLLFTWNTLEAISHRAARVAVVCPPDHGSIKNIAMFGTPGASYDVLPNFTDANIQIDYLNDTFNTIGAAAAPEYVRVQIVNYQIDLAIPFVNASNLLSPSFTTIIPAESMGFVPTGPDTATVTCFGVA